MMLATIATVAALGAPAPALGWTLYLRADLGVRDSMRRCLYSDGNVYAFDGWQPCPPTIEGRAPGIGRGTGFLVGEREESMSRVCFYDVLGTMRSIRVPIASICPVSREFR
jgi:hypothetical protein